MESLTLLIALVLALTILALGTVAAMTVLLWRERSQTRLALTLTAQLLERGLDQLSTTRADELVRMRTAPSITPTSTSPEYPPTDGELGSDDSEPDAYQAARDLGVPDDVIQYLEQ